MTEKDNNIYLHLCKENLRCNPVHFEKLMTISVHSSARTLALVDRKNLFNAASKRFGHTQYQYFLLTGMSLLILEPEM
jgi:hypothetical protein